MRRGDTSGAQWKLIEPLLFEEKRGGMPRSPRGPNLAVITRSASAPPDGAVATSKPSLATPGSFISAVSTKRRGGSIAVTRQKPSASPSRSSSALRRPRRRPGPPVSRSMMPRTRHSQSTAY